MTDFEPIVDAVLEVARSVPGVVFASRYRLGLEALPDQPACIVGMNGARATPSHGLPTKWTLDLDVGYLARDDGGEESPEAAANGWLGLFQDALSADITLGGLCDHAWISGDVQYLQPMRDFPWMQCWVSVEVMVVG